MNQNKEPVVVEQSLNAPPEVVWDAITNVVQMRQWFFENIPAFEPKVGFETEFNVRSETRDFLHLWAVTEVLPMNRIKYDWRYRGYPGDSFVVFDLSPRGDSTDIKVSHHVRENFPDDVPEFNTESCQAGWSFFIKERLRDFVEEKE